MDMGKTKSKLYAKTLLKLMDFCSADTVVRASNIAASDMFLEINEVAESAQSEAEVLAVIERIELAQYNRTDE